ncbi:MAG: hypothetical protein SPK03_01910 [Alloprevotella sp.]|nr:hypothetical protein [Alloprevotella sp.]
MGYPRTKSVEPIKLTRENPFFTSAGDYTLDVVLPLSGCMENLQIFGALQYRSVSLKFLAGKKFPFRLVTELLTLEGTAIVTNVTQDEVKVQLLAGNSALNFDTLGEDGEKYIDGFDLGRAYGDLWDNYHPNEEQTDVGTMRMLMSAPFTIEQTDRLLHGSVEETDCVCFPIWSDTDAAWANQHQYAFWGDNSSGDKIWRDDARTYRFILKGNESDFYPDFVEYPPNSMPYTADPPRLHLRDNLVLAPQPYLCIIVERVLGALGYSLAPEDNALHQGWMGQVFIANARGTLHFAGCVPHWTVKEFFTELRNLFGVIVLVEGKRARVVSRTTLYTSGSAVEILSATDERSTDIDTEGEQKETTSGNVGYAFTDIIDKQIAIGEDAYEKMDVRRMANADLAAAFQSVSEEERAKSNILFYTTSSGSRFGIFHNTEADSYSLTEVDYAGPLFRDEDFKVDTQLRIVPASMAEDKAVLKTKYIEHIVQGRPGYYTFDKLANADERSYDDFHVPYLITADTLQASSKTLFNLQTYIESEEDTTQDEAEKQEVMEVAVNCGSIFTQSFQPNKVNEPDLFYTVSLPYPVGVPYYRSRVDDSIVHVPDCMQFLLHYPGSPVNLCLTAGKLNIDTRVVRQISFTDRASDPNRVYLINGKKYLCQKIEITLDDQGVQPLKKGYFFEVE